MSVLISSLESARYAVDPVRNLPNGSDCDSEVMTKNPFRACGWSALSRLARNDTKSRNSKRKSTGAAELRAFAGPCLSTSGQRYRQADQALGRRPVSCPRSSSHFATHGGDKQATENKERVSRFRPHFNAANLRIGTLERDDRRRNRRRSESRDQTKR